MKTFILFAMAFAAIGSTAWSEDTKSVPEWKPKAKHMESLGKTFEQEGISLRPPAGFSRVSHPRAAELRKTGSQIYTWIQEDESGINLTFAVQVLPKQESAQTRVEEMDNATAGVQKAFRKLESYKISKPTDGKLGGSPARRVHFSAIVNDQKILGFIVATNDGNGVVLVTGITPSTKRAALGVMASAALTVKREQGHSSAK